MEKIINLGIPHVAELVFDGFDTSDLINYMEVSETWKVLAEDVLIKRCKRWKGKIFEACKTGKTKIVQLLNASENTGWTAIMYACGRKHIDVVKLRLDLEIF